MQDDILTPTNNINIKVTTTVDRLMNNINIAKSAYESVQSPTPADFEALFTLYDVTLQGMVALMSEMQKVLVLTANKAIEMCDVIAATKHFLDVQKLVNEGRQGEN